MDQESCVYLTSYYGNKMPIFYIGSTTVARLTSGYHGTVESIRYGKIWKEELKSNPHLFKTRLVSRHPTRKLALEHERNLQKFLNVVKSPMYINQAIAAPNGSHGRDVAGHNNPMFGKSQCSESRDKISKKLSGLTRTQGQCVEMSKRQSKLWTKKKKEERSRKYTGSGNPMYGKIGEKNPNIGRKAGAEERAAKSKALTGRKKSNEHVRKFSKVYSVESEINGEIFIGYGLTEFSRAIGSGASLLLYHFQTNSGKFTKGFRIIANHGFSDNPSTTKLVDFLMLQR